MIRFTIIINIRLYIKSILKKYQYKINIKKYYLLKFLDFLNKVIYLFKLR